MFDYFYDKKFQKKVRTEDKKGLISIGQSEKISDIWTEALRLGRREPREEE